MVGLMKEKEKKLGPEEQLKLYQKGICYRCKTTLHKKEGRKQCHNCLGHFELLGRILCFVSWEIEGRKEKG